MLVISIVSEVQNLFLHCSEFGTCQYSVNL
jgi:hypothetical protein